MLCFQAGGREGWLHPIGPQTGELPLVWLLAGEMTQERLAEMESILLAQIAQGKCRPFVLAGFGPVDWDRDYAPWPLKTQDGRRFGSGAQALTEYALQVFLPAAKAYFCSNGERYAVGYSLGGLAALYTGAQGQWTGVGSCSGSLWYPGFVEWFKQHPPRCPVYLSLGGKEKNTRDPLMARVEECTRAVYEQLRGQNKTAFVHEPGGHFRDTAQRLSHAITWLLGPAQSARNASS